ncbi:MAG TPA: trypsin, partial [Oceanospirillales bacterium]|nr:trypsin [Oceanospirillales bacterium]
MKTTKSFIIFSVLIMFYCSTALAQAKSPYLKILNKDANIDRMPLLLTTVDANITGLIVEVKVTQVYKNNGTVPLEAQYVFPGSRQAAVHKVSMKIGDRLLEAEIQEKKQARVTYNQAKKAGKTTTLLEQKDPGLFTMMVANILPNDEINVELTYTERLIPENGKYRFTYPAIGIPSVLNNKKGLAVVKNDQAMGFDMIIKLNSAIAIEDIRSLNHAVDIDYRNENEALVMLDVDETLNFKEDFIVEYSLQGQKINSGILLYQDKNESYF